VVADLVDATAAQFGGIDVAVHNARVGVGERHYDVADLSTEEYRRVKSVNEDGTFYLTRAVLPYVRETTGHLVYVASYAGQQPRAYDPVYAASECWMRGFAKSVSSQVGEADVGVTVVNPAAVRTEFDVDGESMAERYGPGEAVDPLEVAETVAFAAERSPSMIHEVDVYTRDKLGSI
jgi:NADP-dependent 3-hydroxy acid dehydrogenase YdfG